MRPIRWLFLGGTALLLSGCLADIEERAAELVPDEDMAAADRALQSVLAGDAAGARGQLHPSLDEEARGTVEVWEQIAGLLDGAERDALDLIGVNVNLSGNSRTTSLTYEVEADRGWRVIAVSLLDGSFYGINVQESEGSLVEANRFRAGDAGLTHALFLLYGLFTLVLASYASFRVLQSNIARRKLWAVLSFAMVGKAQLTWATGAVTSNLIMIHIPPVTIQQAGSAAPLLVGFGLPVFALVALRKVSKAQLISEGEADAEGVSGKGPG